MKGILDAVLSKQITDADIVDSSNTQQITDVSGISSIMFPFCLFFTFCLCDAQNSPSVRPLVQVLGVQAGHVHRDGLVEVFQDLDGCLSGPMLQ